MLSRFLLELIAIQSEDVNALRHFFDKMRLFDELMSTLSHSRDSVIFIFVIRFVGYRKSLGLFCRKLCKPAVERLASCNLQCVAIRRK